MEWVVNYVKLEHVRGLLMCPWCQANMCEDEEEQRFAVFGFPAAPWNGIPENAPWRQTVWASASLWRAYRGGTSRLHAMFSLLGVLNVYPDAMLIWDLGIDNHALGNALWEMSYLPHFFPMAHTAKDGCDCIWQMIAREYHLRGSSSQVSTMELSFFTDPKSPNSAYPDLTTRVIAAETRELVPVIASVWEHVCFGSDHDQNVRMILNSLAEFYDELGWPEHIMPAGNVQRFQTAVSKFFAYHRALHREAIHANQRRWHEAHINHIPLCFACASNISLKYNVPKFHVGQHVAISAAGGPPRW